MKNLTVILMVLFSLGAPSAFANGVFNRGAFWQKIDWTPPTCTISTVLSGWRANTSEVINFSCSDNRQVKAVQCQVNSGGWANCPASPSSTTYTASGLVTGTTYVFEVRAIDILDNVSVVQSRTWSVDLTAPTIDSVTPSGTNTGSPSFSFTGSDSMSGVNRYECSYDTGTASWSTCTSPRATTGLTAAGATYYFRVRNVDNVNWTSTVNVTSWTNGNWTAFGSCSVSCGGGTQSRTCTSPSPSVTPPGVPCAGASSQACNTAACCVAAHNNYDMCSGYRYNASTYTCGKSTCYQCTDAVARCRSNSDYLSGTYCYCN